MKWCIERKWTWQDLTAKIKVVTNHRHKVFKKQRTRYHKHENDIGTSAVQDLQKELQRQTSALSPHARGGSHGIDQGGGNPEPNANQMHCQWNRRTGPISAVNRNNRPSASCAGISMRLSDFPHVVRGASIITETAAAHSHNPDTTNRPAATDKFTTTSSQKLLSQSWNYTSYRQVMKLIITVAFTNKWITHIMGTDVITCF